jgi:hypothetical protein
MSVFCSSRWVAKLCRKVVQRHALIDLGQLSRGVAGAIELTCRHRLHRVAARK